jgi:acetyl-CoA acyltransferase
MTRVPQGGFNFSPNLRFRSPANPGAEIPIDANISMGDTAENVANRCSVSRADQDQLAWQSQQKAHSAQQAGRLSDEILPVTAPGGVVETDGCLRPGTTLEGLAGLKPVFGADGSVTAGTASPLTDGAAAVVVCSEDYARANGLPVVARIRAFATVGCEPEEMGMGPVGATRKALERAGLTIQDIGVVEMNEAFASQAIACMRELAIPEDRLNLDGGGIAIGHPLGATGARITGKAAQLLQREGKQFALSTQCIGGGQGIATILEAAYQDY